MNRALFMVGLAILVGVLATIAVAWGLSLWSPAERTARTMVRLPSVFGRQARSAQSFSGTFVRGTYVKGEYDISVSMSRDDVTIQLQYQAGWPLLALSGSSQSVRNPGWLISDMRPWTGIAFPDRLPLIRPIWPGFAVNTVFYATILWLLICGPFALRRLVGRRRGLCPACAYPMGESAICTECGRALPGRTEAVT